MRIGRIVNAISCLRCIHRVKMLLNGLYTVSMKKPLDGLGGTASLFSLFSLLFPLSFFLPHADNKNIPFLPFPGNPPPFLPQPTKKARR